jgi:hypothetical protein
VALLGDVGAVAEVERCGKPCLCLAIKRARSHGLKLGVDDGHTHPCVLLAGHEGRPPPRNDSFFEGEEPPTQCTNFGTAECDETWMLVTSLDLEHVDE